MGSYRCFNCSKEAFEFILRCCRPPEFGKEVVYCCEKCQIENWPKHKKICERNKKPKKTALPNKPKKQSLNVSPITDSTSKSALKQTILHNETTSEKDDLELEDVLKYAQNENLIKDEFELIKEIEKDKMCLKNAQFDFKPIFEQTDEEKAIETQNNEQFSLIKNNDSSSEEKPIQWHRPQTDNSRKLQVAVMSKENGMKHIILRYIFNKLKNGDFEPIDFNLEHIDSTFEASFDILENYEDFLLISRRNDSINNFAAITFEADFSPISDQIFLLKQKRAHCIDVGDQALEMQLNHDIFSAMNKKEEIENAYNKAKLEIARNGIIIIESNADGAYNFAGSSPSRNEACFFYRGTPETIFKMIHQLGDFSLIPDTQKRSKRIGLLFSSLRIGFEIEHLQWEKIPDIKSNGFNFTDGCGFVSADIISKACKILEDNKKIVETMPSVIQVRFLGFKGILLLKKSLHNKIQFRESMLKFNVFEGKHDKNFLGIVNYSTPFHLTYLSLQSVMLLSALGVKDETFYDLQTDYFAKIGVLLESPLVAYNFCRLRDRELMRLIEKYGFSKVVINRLRVLRRKELERGIKKIKRASKNRLEAERLRIFVPKGRLVYGVCDPFGLLKYGECFFNPTLEEGYSKIFNAEVLVFRNPCYHLGDIRKLRCVEADDRYKIYRDVIIFPTTGPRPHCDEMSSGDLDGDMYSVLWDERFVNSANIVEPFYISIQDDGTSTKNRRTTSSINELYERQKWFAFHSSNNSLGLINNTFLKYANKYGPEHPECTKIGALFNMSLDFGVFDEAHLKEVSRRINSLEWEKEEGEERVWQKLLKRGKNLRRNLMIDIGIVILVRVEDGLAIVQCRKRERIFVDSKWENHQLQKGDCIKFGARWNRERRLLMAVNVVLLKNHRHDLVQQLHIPRLFGVVTRIKKLSSMEMPSFLPEHLHVSTLEGFIYFRHTYMKSVLKAAKKVLKDDELVGSYARFDDKSFARDCASIKKGDKVSFRLCYSQNGNLAVREIRFLEREQNDFCGEEEFANPSKLTNEKESTEVVLVPFVSAEKKAKLEQNFRKKNVYGRELLSL